MKRFVKKTMVALLSVAMVITMIPFTALPVEAATNQQGGFQGMDADVFTALGFDVKELPEGYDPDTTDNPLGRDKTTGNQVFELAVAGNAGTKLYGKGNNNVKSSDISGIPGGTGVSMEMSASAAADFDGDGLAGEIVYVGYDNVSVKATRTEDGHVLAVNTPSANLQFQIYSGKSEAYGDAKTIGTVNAMDTAYKTYDSLIQNSFYSVPHEVNTNDANWQNLLQVSAGDYDGDGISEIAIYMPEKGSPRIDVYKYQKNSNSVQGDWIDPNKWERVWSHALSGEYVPNMVSLVSGDFNRDGTDDLGISYGRAVFKYRSNSYALTDMDTSQAVMLWGDREKSLQNSSPINLNTEELGEQARVSLIKGDLNEDGVEELIATGQPASDLQGYGEALFTGGERFDLGNTQRTIITYVYDTDAGLLINTSDLMKPVDGEYITATVGDSTTTRWKSNNGFDDTLHSEPFMRTNAAVFRAEWADYPYLYLDSCLYQYSNGTLALLGEMDEKYDGQHSIKDKDKITDPAPLPGQYWGARQKYAYSTDNGFEQAYYTEYGAVCADINGAGYGVLATSSFDRNSKAYDRHITQYSVLSGSYVEVNGKKEGRLKATITNPTGDVGDTNPLATTDYKGVTLTFIDCDIDTIILEYTGQHYLTYSDPKVLAVIAAAPYFEDVDEATGYEFAGNNTTSWGRTHGDSESDSVSVSFEFGAWAENTIVTATGQISLNGGLVYTLEWEKTKTLSHEYTMTFGTYGDQDAVAFYSIPTENYVYRVYVPNEKGGYESTSYVVSNTFDPAYQVLTLDYYESIQKNYSALPAIRGTAITSTPGDPASYPSSESGYKVITKWDKDAAGVGFGNGSIEQEISISSETEESYSMGAEFSFELGGGLSAQVDLTQNKYESTGGMQFAINPAGGWAETHMRGTTITAEVANMPVEFQQYGYYFDWKLFSYYYTFGDTDKEKKLTFSADGEEEEDFSLEDNIEIGEATNARIPVISYIVNNVSQPPTLPDDFQQDFDRTTSDTNVMTWTYDSPCTAFIISKYFDFPVGGGIQQIARIEPGDSDHYKIKYDEDGKPYKEFFFEDTNLAPYTEYEYAIQIERLVPPPPLSTPSALTTARTKAENGYPNINIAESDDEQDGKLLVYPDKNAYLSAGVTGPEGENINNYYSVVQYQWQKQEKGAWGDLIGETNKTLTFASAGVDTEGEYRCRVNVITKADNTAITAYSDSVELTHAKRTSYMKEVSVTDVAGGGVQLYAEVGNAHKDSASIPGGSVTFNLTSNSTGDTYMYIQPLTAAGTATAIVDEELPEGMYTVKAYYAGSYIFKACSGESLYLSQRASGYDIDLPNSVTYGNEAQVVFREATKAGGVTTTRNVNSDITTMYMAAPLSRAALSGAEDYVAAEGQTPASVTAGTPYRYTDPEGVKWYFTAPVSGVPTFDNGYVLFGDNLANKPDAEKAIDKAPGAAGIYLIKAGTPIGVYRITMQVEEEETASAVIEILPRQVTVQIPKTLSTGESPVISENPTTTEEAADPIFISDLALVNGSWADCDIDENGTFKYANESIDPEYYNTAGTMFTAANVRKLCGAYSIIGTKQLDNYSINYRSGQLTVLGAAYDVKIGARNFDKLNVGKVYMMAPEIGVANGPLNETGSVTKQIQAGVRMVFSAQPDDGYEIYDWYINGVAQGTKNSTLAYTMLAETTTVEVQFAIKQNTLTYGTVGDENGGTLTCEPALASGSILRKNSHFEFTAKANPGFHFKEWRYTEQGQGTIYDDEDNGEATSTFDFFMPDTSCSLYAVFERDGYVFNYIDGNNANGLTATYENEEGKIVTAKPGAIIKGGTEITVAPASGYDWDQSRQYVSQGTQGTASYPEGTYVLTLDQDTTVYGWTNQQTYDLKLGYALARTSQQVPDAVITYYIDDKEYTFSCREYLEGGGNDENEDGYKTIENIPGGAKITATVDVPGWVDLKGWTGSATAVTASRDNDPLAGKVSVDSTVQKDKHYYYTTGEGNTSYYFISPVNGSIRSLDGENVTLYASSATYTIPALGQDEKLTVGLKEKAVHTVNMEPIDDKGEYSYELPAGGFNGDTANIVKVHDGDDFTVTVLPNPGQTVSYWKTTPMVEGSGETVTRPATSLRYTIPAITMDFNFEPIFSNTTYNLVSWPTISEKQNKLTLNPESGYISSVASGEDFQFTLTGDSLNLVEGVYGNGNEFTTITESNEGNDVNGTIYSYDSETGVYSITNLTENQEITVKLREIGVMVNGVDISAFSGAGWNYDSGTQTLTLTRSGLNLSSRLSGNDQELAPSLKIVTTEAVGTLVLDDLTVKSAANPILEVTGDTIVTITDNNTLQGNTPEGAIELTIFTADSDLTLRGNGNLDIESEVQNSTNNAVSLKANLNITGTVNVNIHEKGAGNGLYISGTMTVGVENNTLSSPTLHMVSANGNGAWIQNVNLYGGEISARGKTGALSTPLGSGETSINCYDGILELSSETGEIIYGSLKGDYLRAYYKKGYMCRSREWSDSTSEDYTEPAFTTYSRLAKDYTRFDVMPAYDPVIQANEAGGCGGAEKYDYMRLSPMTGGAEKDDLTLYVTYKGKQYYRDLKDYTGACVYYIDPDDTGDKLRVLPWLGNAGNGYAVYNDTGYTYSEDPDESYQHLLAKPGVIVVAEYISPMGTAARDLHFNVMQFEKIQDQVWDEVNNEPLTDENGNPVYEYRTTTDNDGNITGYYYDFVKPTGEPLKLDYKISGSMSGSVSSDSRGSIHGDGYPCSAKYFSDNTDNVASLTLDNLTHVSINVKDYPVYLQGNNYLIGSDFSTCPLIATTGTLDLRGSGTLTISTPYMTALTATTKVKLTDVAALTLFSDTTAIGTGTIEYYSGEGTSSVELPYGLGWLEDTGSMAGDAVTLSQLNSNPGVKYVKFYNTSTDARSTPEKLVYDKSKPDTSPTVAKATLTPPTVMGEPHLFTPGVENSGCKVELYQNTKKIADLTNDTNYTYTPDTDVPVIGTLEMLFTGDAFKDLEIGEYTLKVYFADKDLTDATNYTLDIPLTVQDTAHIIGRLEAKADKEILTRGSIANITTKFTGTTPSSYEWALYKLLSEDPPIAITEIEGVSMSPNGDKASVTIGKNAENGVITVSVSSHIDDQTQGIATVELTIVPQAESITISCQSETPSGDESYMLNHNTLDGNPKDPWAFDAAVTMDDGTDGDAANISWTLWGGTMAGTEVDQEGKLTINPNETGLMNSGYLILTATYTNEDGTKLDKPIKIRLSEDAIVGYTQAAEGGTIQAAKVTNPDGTPIPKNTEVTFTATPSEDYEVDTWYINGQPVEDGVEGNTMTFTTEKMGRYNVWATFAKVKNCKVNYEKTGSGTITAETENGTLASGDKVAGGTTVTFTAVPDTYNKITAWYVNGEKQEGESGETLTLSNISSDVSVKVDFAVPDRTATVTTIGNGTVTFLVDGIAQPVTPDETGKYVVTAPADQIITALAVPGEESSVEGWSKLTNATASDAICTVPRSMENAEATVTFQGQITHEVTVSTNSYENGSGTVTCGSYTIEMSSSRIFEVPDGGSLVMTAAPDKGCILYDWETDPAVYKDRAADGEELVLTNIKEDITVGATFRRGNNTLSLIKEGDGTLTADYYLKVGETTLENDELTAPEDEAISQTIRSGASVVVTVTPGSGQIPASFTVNGEDKSADLVKLPNEVKYTYTIEALTKDTEIKAAFDELKMYEVTGHEDYTVKVTDESDGEPVETDKPIGTVTITKFGVENGFNYEVEGATPQQVKVVPNTPVEILFQPAKGHIVNTATLSEGVLAILDDVDSQASISFKQSANGTILLIEGIDQDLDFSDLDNPFEEQKEDDVYVTLNLHYGDNGTLTVANEAEHIQYTNGASILSGTEITYEAVPKEHYSATVKVNNEESETAGTLTLTDDMDEISIDADFVQSEYPVTITTLGRGSGKVTINNKAYAPGEYWLSAGSELIIRAEAADGCAVDEFLVAGAEVTGGSTTVTLNEPDGIDVIATFSDTMRSVTYNSPANGKLKVLDAQGKEVAYGASEPIGSKLYVVYTPDPHYTLQTLTVGGKDLTGDYFTVDEERGNNVYCDFTRAEDRVTWIAVYGTVDAQLMPEGESIGNGQYVPAGSQIKFKVTPKNSNYSLESLTVNGEAMSADNYYEADQEDVEAIAICEYTGDVPGVKEGVKVSMLTVNCTLTAELADGTKLENGDYVKTGDKIKFTHKPTSSGYTLDKFTVIGAEADKSGMYVAGSEDIVASAVYNAPATIIHDPDVPLDVDAAYTVLIETEGGGHVDVTIKGDAVKSGAEVDLGSKLTIKAVPDEGQKVASLTVNGVKFANGEEYVVYANTLIKAVFEEGEAEIGLPCYKDDKGNIVYSGFSYDLNGDGEFTENEYIIPKGVDVHFRENHKYFEDMPGNWADEYIQFVGDREIFQGVTDTLFDPEGKVTRAMYVTVIGRLYERSFGAINGGTAQNFTDCDYDSWYGKYVDWAAATGVVNGYDAQTFGPNDNVTREQMAAILTRFAKLMKLDTKASGSLSFTDTDTISDYAVDSVQYCVDKGIINGYDDGRFAPQDNATRAQIAAVIVRFIESVLSE